MKDRLAKALQEIARNPEVLKTFESLGIESVATSPEQAVEAIQKDMAIVWANCRYGGFATNG